MWIMLKTIILFLNNHKRNIINWIVNFFFFLSSITYKVSLFKTWCKLMMFQKSFCMFKTTMNNHFFQMSFFISNVHHSFSKLKRILILMIIKAKHLKFIKFFWKHIWTYLFQICFWPWKLWIWKFVFNKSYSFLCYLEHGCIIYAWYKAISNKK
jgi:hypothetical protein